MRKKKKKILIEQEIMITPQAQRKFLEDGYLVIESILDDSLLQQLRKESDFLTAACFKV